MTETVATLKYFNVVILIERKTPRVGVDKVFRQKQMIVFIGNRLCPCMDNHNLHVMMQSLMIALCGDITVVIQ